jgi:N-acetylmuramoyl-L-alanine amidase
MLCVLANILVLDVVFIGIGYTDEQDWDLGICLDPGHGGEGACKWSPPCSHYGTCGPSGPCLTEDWVNHEIAPFAAGVWDGVAVLTRQSVDEDFMSPTDRARVANDADGVDLFVSVHHNCYPCPGDPGSLPQRTEAFYADTSVPNPETGEWRYRLADAVLDRVRNAFDFDGELSPGGASGDVVSLISLLLVLH